MDASDSGVGVDGCVVEGVADGLVFVVEVLAWDEEEEELVCWMTLTNSFDCVSHRAKTCGLDGSTSNRAMPSSQQKGREWSQQKDVSVLVTLEQDMRSVPPVLAPRSHVNVSIDTGKALNALRQYCGQSADTQCLSVHDPLMVCPSGLRQSLFVRQTEP